MLRQVAAEGMLEYQKYLSDHSDPHFEHPYLKPTSLVVDVGGFRGDWTAKILHKYGPFVNIFEPITQNLDILKLRFQNDYRVNICPVALGDHDERKEIFVDEDKSSFFVNSSSLRKESILVQDVGKYISGADLISLNCEGSEYQILPRLIQTNLIRNFKNVQIQFHYEYIAPALELREEIRQALAKTHEQVYCFPFVWESWRRKY